MKVRSVFLPAKKKTDVPLLLYNRSESFLTWNY